MDRRLLFSVIIILVAGCAPDIDLAERCVKACQETAERSSGPCILDPIAEDPDWVCDIAHSPREPVDNIPENQCSSYRAGKAHHFIEVSLDCAVLRSV